MGFAASQARYLLLTARQSDIEYKVQQINNRRLALSYKLEGIAKRYADGIADKRLYVNLGGDNGKQELSYELITNALTNANGGLGLNVVYVSGYNNDGEPIYTNVNQTPGFNGTIDQDVLQRGLYEGAYHLQNAAGDIVDWRSEMPEVTDELYQDNDEVITANYEYESSLVHEQDKRLELELKSLETQHKAIETEVQAVKKIIDKNIESSFKTFG